MITKIYFCQSLILGSTQLIKPHETPPHYNFWLDTTLSTSNYLYTDKCSKYLENNVLCTMAKELMENIEIKSALEKKEEAAWELIRAAIALFKAVDYDPGLHQVAEVIDAYYNDIDAGKQMLNEFREKISALEKANQDFLKVVKEQQKQVDIS